jgi:16S rRNA (cytidine1402-2'-O)-methyltransferase
MERGTLYLIPAGLGDAPWRATLPLQARDIACRLECFIVENAKSARAELKRLGYPRPLQTVEMRVLPETGTAADFDELVQPLLAGKSVGLLAEAGCPAVADPGAAVVRLAHRQGIRVVPLVGPSSIVLALMASGLDGQRFVFHGYLPVRDDARRKAILALETESRRWRQTQIFIETPYRNAALLQGLLQVCQPATLLCVATNLTLTDEAIATRTIAHWRKAETPEIARRPTVFLLLAE